jgi:phage tail sheath protein FI
MLLNGHIATEQYPNVITASMSSNDYEGSYFPSVLNKDPTKYQESGHFLYAWYDVPTSMAAITGTLILNHATSSGDPNKHDAVFITSSSIGRNSSNASTPNYEQFKERYAHPQSPFVVSQDYGGTRYNLFRIHSISDGYVAGDDYTPDLANSLKVTISNIVPADPYNPYPTFDVTVRSLNQADDNFAAIKQFPGVTLNPNSEFYIASKIGDQNIYFDFDRANGSQKIAVEGDYPVTNNYIRLELSDDFIAGNVPEDAVPAGFRGYGYVFTSGSNLATFGSANTQIVSGQSDVIKRALIPPVPMRLNLNDEPTPSEINSNLTWGTQVEEITSLTVPNETTSINKSIGSFIKFFPSYDTTGKKFFIENSDASDRFENNLFSIENIQVVTSSTGIADNTQWISASYIRQGNIASNDTNKTRALQVSDLSDSTNRDNVAFTFFLQGGFDGTNIFDVEKSKLTDLAAMREIDDVANQGGVNGPTVMSYKKAVDIMGSTSDVTMQLFAMPGIRVPAITNYAITAIENRFDALYLVDIQQKNDLNSYITSSAENPSVVNTVADFKTRSLNTSFAAAYFPDVIVQVPDETSSSTSSAPRTVVVPPSAAVLSAYAKNDVYAPWYAPAGSTRGVISRAEGLACDLSETDSALGTIYDADINPIVELSGGTGTIVTWGQKTLLKTASSLDRVNVRRLLIDVRRRVRAVANSLLFEPNTQATLAKFNSLVNPIMQDVQTRFGVTRYKVVIDTSTTTQADIDNNTIRGKIFLQPVRTAEFISIDFTISPRSTT